MTQRGPRRPVVRPTSVAMMLCGVIMVGVPAAAAVLEPGNPPRVGPATGGTAPLPAGQLADILPPGLALTASTAAVTGPVGSLFASTLPYITTTAKPGSAAAKAIEFALAQRGLPYVWGGNGPQNGDAGFDCSGLTKASYAAAGIDLPRTAHTQFYAGPHVPDGAPLEPGDLVFYGVPQRVHHVGLYLGGGRMINAPDFGEPIQLAYVRYPGDDYIGATRPAAGKDAPGLLDTSQLPVPVPPTPSPDVPRGPTTFLAPVAPDPAPNAVLGAATPAALKASPTLPDTPPVAGPAAPAAPAAAPLTEGSADAPQSSAPTTGPPAAVAPPDLTEPTTTPPATPPPPTTTPAPTTTTEPPPTTQPPTTSPAPVASPAPSPAPPPQTVAPTTTTPPAAKPETVAPATTTPTATPAAAVTRTAVAPTSLTLPGGLLPLTAAKAGPDGLPPVPPSPARGTRTFHPGGNGAGTAAVRLAGGYDVSGLTVGARFVATGPGGATYTLAVTSRSLMTPAQAKAAAATLGKSYRVVLLQTDPATGNVLVIVAA